MHHDPRIEVVKTVNDDRWTPSLGAVNEMLVGKTPKRANARVSEKAFFPRKY